MSYKAKHSKTLKINHFKKSAALLLAMVLIVTVGVGSTLAYLMDNSTAVTNTFTPTKVSCVVDEDFDGIAKTNVKIKNTSDTGDVPAYIRAAVVVTWKDAINGNVYGQKPLQDTDYSINLSLNTTQNEDVWIQGADGFYYFTSPVPVDGFTNILIHSCEPVADKAPSGYHLSVEIVAEAIQAKPTEAVTSSWSSGVSGVSGTTLLIKQ